MAQKLGTPKGTRDFSPTELAKRNYIIDAIKKSFQVFGFQPIETPSFENYQTLMGKYGEEGDRLIFKILNSGDFLANVSQEVYNQQNSQKITPQICEKALRYDLTVPFARYVVQHQNEIVFPFKRYQIQPVWRADRPQKGRFREFFQCDADVVGSNSLWQEVEFIQLYDFVFTSLKISDVTIKINHRKILSGFSEIIGEKDKLIDFTTALDKLDKIGKEKVIQEMLHKGISAQAIEKVEPIFELKGSFSQKVEALKSILASSEEGMKGIQELEFLNEAISQMPLKTASIELDTTLARGLNYYTGAIFEVAPPKQVGLGSIGGGGRYDNLTEIFGLKNMSGIGISFGLDRIYLLMEELNLFPPSVAQNSEVLFLNFGEREAMQSMKLLRKLREKNIKAELFPEASKLKKQMAYADKKQIKFVVMIGDKEFENQQFVLKNMADGTQQTYHFEQLFEAIN